jgi:hypothetical protein
MEFWLIDMRVCVLCSVQHELEVRLYERGQLIALEPCQTAQEALRISHRWRTTPPTWPPF